MSPTKKKVISKQDRRTLRGNFSYRLNYTPLHSTPPLGVSVGIMP